MPDSICCVRVNHINVVMQDFEQALEHFRSIYDAELLLDMPKQEWHACLISVGQVILELFAPYHYLLNARYGPHYLGIEYQADMDEVRRAIAARGIRIIRELGVALHTHPADCFGVSFEFYGGEFHSRDYPLLGGPIKSAQYWRDDHALGLTGLKGYTLAVSDIEAATQFLQSLLSATVAYEVPRPAIGARAVGLNVADAIIEVVTPVGSGHLQQHLAKMGDGIYSTVFGVQDRNRAARYFEERGIALEPGCADDTMAIPAAANLGLVFEFSETWPHGRSTQS